MYLLGPPELVSAVTEDPNVRWYNDYYYTIHAIDGRTYAIAETRYWQYNFNYLILGNSQAILFDAGPGVRDIWPVVRSLTKLPVLFIPSHLHYDHLGRPENFEQIGLSEKTVTPTIRVDVISGYVFSGDFLVPGALAEFSRGGGMGNYLGGF